MKKVALIALIVVMAVLFTACSSSYFDTIKWEKRVIEEACNELDIPTRGVKLQLAQSEFVTWLGCISYTYVMATPDGTKYLVEAYENEEEFYCRVAEVK